LERIRKEAVVANLRFYPCISLYEMRKITKNLRVAGVPAESVTGHLPSISQKRHCFSQLAWLLRKRKKGNEGIQNNPKRELPGAM
jgi:hypothetical protein